MLEIVTMLEICVSFPKLLIQFDGFAGFEG